MLTGSTLCTPCAFLVFACLCPVWTLRCCSLLLERGVGYGCRPVCLSGCCLPACVLAWLLLLMISMSLPKRVRFTLFLRLCLLLCCSCLPAHVCQGFWPHLVTCMLTAVLLRPLFRSCSRIRHACVVLCERRKRAFFSLRNNATG